jgi:hypothetical protein
MTFQWVWVIFFLHTEWTEMTYVDWNAFDVAFCILSKQKQRKPTVCNHENICANGSKLGYPRRMDFEIMNNHQPIKGQTLPEFFLMLRKFLKWLQYIMSSYSYTHCLSTVLCNYIVESGYNTCCRVGGLNSSQTQVSYGWDHNSI